MLVKLVVSLVLAAITFALTRTPAYAVYVFLLEAAVAFVLEGVRVVPQQSAFVVERFGRFHATLEPGLNFIVPVFDRVAYRHSLKEVPLDVPEQVCITKDNTQLGVDGILYFQVTDPRLASYGSSNYITAISQLAQTTLRSEPIHIPRLRNGGRCAGGASRRSGDGRRSAPGSWVGPGRRTAAAGEVVMPAAGCWASSGCDAILATWSP